MRRSSQTINKRRSTTHKKTVHGSKGVGLNKNRSLRKIQPQGKNTSQKKQSRPIKMAGIIFAILAAIYLIFIFEFPANYPKNYAIESLALSSKEISLKLKTSTYNKKLIPLEYLMAIGDGEITLIDEKETTITLNDKTQIIIKEGSGRIKINKKTARLNAPVMTLEDGTVLIPGQLLEKLYPEQASFEDGIATISLLDADIKGEYTEFTGAEGYMRLVNKNNQLTAAFAPTDLIDVNSYGSIPAYGENTKLRKKAADALVQMYNAGAGIKYIMSSGFRNFEEQTGLYKEETNKNISAGMGQAEAEAKAGTVVALPGTSEHQLGLAVDFSIPEVVLTEDFKNTEAGKWLAANSYKYGYVLRYTQEQSAITNIIYEPWHFRYIGYPHSEILYKEKIVYDTYIENLRKAKIKEYQADDGIKYAIWLLTGNLVPEKLTYIEENGVAVSTDNMDNVILTIPVNKK